MADLKLNLLFERNFKFFIDNKPYIVKKCMRCDSKKGTMHKIDAGNGIYFYFCDRHYIDYMAKVARDNTEAGKKWFEKQGEMREKELY